MATIAVDISALVDGQNADADDVTTPILDLKSAAENIINGDQPFDQLNFKTPTTLTISSGAITVSLSSHKVDTEGAAASDDLDTINGGTVGDILMLRTVNDARDVVIKHGTGNIKTNNELDLTLSKAAKFALLFYDGTTWMAYTGFMDPYNPAAKVNFLASTTAAASISIPAGTAPTSPVVGDIWHDSTQAALYAYIDSIKQNLPGILFTNNVVTTVSNTLAETTIVGAGVGAMSLPANFLRAGKIIRLTIKGSIGTTATPTITFKVKVGGVALVTTAALSPGTISAKGFSIEFVLNTLGSGVSAGYRGTNLVSINLAILAHDIANGTFDTTAINAIDVTATWSAASSSNTITAYATILESLN